jgi:Tol biopolymer transport system component
MDADGSGRKQIQLPNDGYVGYSFKEAVSPDGNWLAYFTGSKDEPYNLALNLINLKNENSFFIAQLIAPGYPQNLKPVADTFLPYFVDFECTHSEECRLEETENAFVEGIETLSWAPDSQAIAFAAQIDGPSSDIYIFTIGNKSIRRLTDELDNIFGLNWAPNGKKILFETSIPGTSYIARDIHVADYENENAQHPKTIDRGVFWRGLGWMTENSYLIVNGGEGASPNNFRFINVDNQQIRKFWKYGLEKFFASPELQGIPFSIYQSESDYYNIPLDEGTYFLHFDGQPIKLSSEVYTPQISGFSGSFFANKDNDLYIIRTDGTTLSPIASNVNFQYSPSTSPDKKWAMVESDQSITLYTEDIQAIKSWNIHNAMIIWRPDSLAVFLITYTGIHYLSVPDGEPMLVNDCTSKNCPFILDDFVWLP